MSADPGGVAPPSQIRFQTLPELSVYVHLPWCVRKCPYCDFNSHERNDSIPEQRYIDALIADLESSLPMVWGRPVVSIFFGGGTPSLFSADAIARLISAIRARMKVLPNAEITLEANPGTFEADRFRGYFDAGVNRLSLGIQSFSDTQLKTLGRVHDRGQAIAAAELAVKTFPKVNLDLMFGLPNQDQRGVDTDVTTAIDLGAQHISCYQLTLEPNTHFAVRPPDGLPDDDALADMQSFVVDRLAAGGLSRYEISAFAAPGQESLHNLNYWTFGDYIGIGAGAHGKISSADRIVRTIKPRHPDLYMGRFGSEVRFPVEVVASSSSGGTSERVDDAALPFEFMLNALRLVKGVPVSRWQQTTGMAVADHPFLLERIGKAQSMGLLARDPGVFRATPRGIELLNDLQSIFLA
jgi:putative oxygen-independent coproporphyrinogen III oxidase